MENVMKLIENDCSKTLAKMGMLRNALCISCALTCSISTMKCSHAVEAKISNWTGVLVRNCSVWNYGKGNQMNIRKMTFRKTSSYFIFIVSVIALHSVRSTTLHFPRHRSKHRYRYQIRFGAELLIYESKVYIMEKNTSLKERSQRNFSL